MATIKVTKRWIEQYFGIKNDRPEQYSSYWQTDGGTATQDFDRLPENEYEIVQRSSSKTYWGKYVHPTVPPPPFGAEQHTQRRTATYGEADRYKEQIIAGWKAGSGVRESSENIQKVVYWQAGRNWNELRANEWHNGKNLNQDIITKLKAESPHGIIVYWHKDDGDTFEDGHVIEW